MDFEDDQDIAPYNSSQGQPESKFRILIASDIHLGYNEKDPIRCDDSFNAFEEVLQIATQQEVDFVLLGGDLFHENKPSSKAMKRCVEILRKYCLGTKQIRFSVVSDQKVNFQHTLFQKVNYEDPNLNIALPIFSIHGNHDDPIGKDPLGALDTLSAVGLVNYFGKYVNVEEINIQPLLLQKEEHKIALYGLGSLPEERLHRLFVQDKVSFAEPEADSKNWLRILVVHQNRVAHGTKYLPENLLGDQHNLVIWGHEHESRTSFEHNLRTRFFVYQPGSTVATSLCPAEAQPKHVGILSVFYDPEEEKNRFYLETIQLKTVRRMFFEDMSLEDALPTNLDPKKTNEIVFDAVSKKIDSLIDKAEIEHSGDPREPKTPLIRVRVECLSEYQHLNPSEFAHKYKDKVANPRELVLFRNKRVQKTQDRPEVNLGELEDLMDDDQQDRCRIEDVVVEYFKNAEEKNQLTMLSENIMMDAIKEIIDKDQSADRILQAIEFQQKRIHEALTKKNIPLEDKVKVKAAIKECREDMIQEEEKVRKDLQKLFRKGIKDHTESSSKATGFSDSDRSMSSGDDLDHSPEKTKGRGRSRGRARGRGRTRGRSK